MRKIWIGKIMLFACSLLMCTSITYAAGDDTDGTELQVAQPVVLQIQLGQQWSGTEFQLKTNAGLYPGIALDTAHPHTKRQKLHGKRLTGT